MNSDNHSARSPQSAMRRPSLGVPILYFATAHVALMLAAFLVAWSPQTVVGFFYHPRMAAVVHLVTLGWITFSILGAIYIVGPMALRMPMPVTRADYVAFGSALTGVVGMVAHFWIQEYGGMAWSAALAAAAVLYVSARIIGALRRSTMPPASRLHIAFACGNIAIAAAAGILIAFDKTFHFLPGFVISNVFAHAHLAAVGWATMMVVGVGYRMLPMVLPARMPAGRTVALSALLMEVGVIGLFVALVTQSRWSIGAGLTIVAGIAIFARDVLGMLRSPVPRPPRAPRVDFAVLHAAAAGCWLLFSIGAGLTLLMLPLTPLTLRLAAAYGCGGLVGALAQMVIGMEARIVPMLTWYSAYARSDYRVAPTPPLQMRDPGLQAIVFAGWTVGVPALAGGLFFEAPRAIAAGGWAMLAATAVSALDSVFVVEHVRLRNADCGMRIDQPFKEQDIRNPRSSNRNLSGHRKTSLNAR
jgi:hypothetical protein